MVQRNEIALEVVMSVAVASKPVARVAPSLGSLRQFSVAEYHRMIETDILTEEDKVELLNGYVVLKMPRNPPHDSTISALNRLLSGIIQANWILRIQSAVTFALSEPEPDLVLARGSWRDYSARHPDGGDIGLLIEVADSSLSRDRDEKGPIYAEAGVVEYWIVNLVGRQIEVYSNPTGTGPNASYSGHQVYHSGDSVPLILDGITIAQFAVQDILP
jgi:Uma2 family endonuclease